MGNITLLNVNILLYTINLHGFIMLLLRKCQDLNDFVTQKQPWRFFVSWEGFPARESGLPDSLPAVFAAGEYSGRFEVYTYLGTGINSM